MSAKNKSNEIKITRLYDAPLKLVWDAWTDPKQVAQWWGPRGFTLTTHKKDLKPGGIWHYTMHGPDGKDYINKTLYHEVVPYTRLVYDHGGNDEQAPLFKVTALFNELKGKTELQMTMTLASPEAAEEIRKHIKLAGGESTWDRLGEFLAKTKSNKELFIINRSFNAPIETVFEMWTNPKHFSSWMGPKGSEMKFFRSDIKVGGSTFYMMSGVDNYKLFGRAHYYEITKPHRLVYTQQFCDENEVVINHPMAPVWPKTMLTTVQLTSEGPNQTRLTITWEGAEGSTPEEIAAFVSARAGMTMGWTGSLDKLEEALNSI